MDALMSEEAVRVPAKTSAKPETGTPDTLYRKHVEACYLDENAFAFDFMCDYLTMMDTLSKSISYELEHACSITTLQYRILLRIVEQRAVLAKQLAVELDAGISTISAAVAKLACKGFVKRQDSACDMRAVELSLTAKGRRVADIADKAIRSAMGQYWSTLAQKQYEAATTSVASAVSRHSTPRIENGRPQLDSALADTVMISRALTSRALQADGLATESSGSCWLCTSWMRAGRAPISRSSCS